MLARDPQVARTQEQRALTVVAENLSVPWSIAFAPDGRIFFTERAGRIRAIEQGKLRAQPVHVFAGVVERGEIGLMGLALHPDFARNHLLYVSYGLARGDGLVVDVIRFRENGNTLADATPIVQNIPAAPLMEYSPEQGRARRAAVRRRLRTHSRGCRRSGRRTVLLDVEPRRTRRAG
jgi:glucose/arabinose dehydrogenase